MNQEVFSRYYHSALKHPERTVIAATSEITRIPISVQFRMSEDPLPIFGVLPESISRYMYLMEGIRPYEPETSLVMQKIVKPGSTTFVIGAHIGVHAILAKHLSGGEGTVIGFEPTPETYALLEKNCHPRNIQTEQVAITRTGIPSVEMTVFDVRHSAWNSAKAARKSPSFHWNPNTITVEATSIDAYCAAKKVQPDVLILDLENGEMDALIGGQTTILSTKPSIIIECGDLGRDACNSTHACLALLQEWGYALFDIDPTNGETHPHQIRDSYPDYYPNVAAIDESKPMH